MTKAHWVSPSGKIIPVKDKHIVTVAEKPTMYGTTIDKMKKEYEKYGETFPTDEGKAREKIMTDIVKRGWIRTRITPRTGQWVAETYKWGRREKDAIWDWVFKMVGGKKPTGAGGYVKFVSVSKNKILGNSTFSDVISYQGDMFESVKKEKIMEASLSRIWRDYQDNEFCIITAWRFECDDEKGKPANNKQNLSALKSGVRSGGFGYVRIDGVGQEECGGKVISVKEPALLVKNVKSGGEPVMDSDKFDKFLIKLGRKYNQWGIVLHSPEKGSRLIALKNDDGKQISPKVDMKMKKFSPMKTGQFFSSLKGKPFKLEGFKYADRPDGIIHGMSMEGHGEVDIFRYESREKWMKQIMEIIGETNK